MMGDFNAKIGTEVKTSASVGEFTIERSNRNGYKLLEFAEQNDLKIVSFFFKKKA